MVPHSPPFPRGLREGGVFDFALIVTENSHGKSGRGSL
jgi:hypothetical protein